MIYFRMMNFWSIVYVLMKRVLGCGTGWCVLIVLWLKRWKKRNSLSGIYIIRNKGREGTGMGSDPPELSGELSFTISDKHGCRLFITDPGDSFLVVSDAGGESAYRHRIGR